MPPGGSWSVTLVCALSCAGRKPDGSSGIRNAVKFTADHSTVTIAAATTSDDQLCVTISDCGPGLPAGETDRIFRPFWRGEDVQKQDGHGLGLAIARQAIDRHGGRITAAPREGGGLVIRFEIPRAAAEPAVLASNP